MAYRIESTLLEPVLQLAERWVGVIPWNAVGKNYEGRKKAFCAHFVADNRDDAQEIFDRIRHYDPDVQISTMPVQNKETDIGGYTRESGHPDGFESDPCLKIMNERAETPFINMAGKRIITPKEIPANPENMLETQKMMQFILTAFGQKQNAHLCTPQWHGPKASTKNEYKPA